MQHKQTEASKRLLPNKKPINKKPYYLLHYNNGTETHSTQSYKTRHATVRNNFFL